MASLTEIGPRLPQFARQVLEQFLSTGDLGEPGASGQPSAPVFVTLHDREHQLRGCIGTLSAQRADVFEETAYNAISAATRDPRFSAVTRKELDDLSIDVTVLHPLEAVSSEDALDPRRYGVVVRDPLGRQGVLLPDLPGIDDVHTQIRIAKQKARIAAEAPVTLFRFLAERFEESATAR